MTGKMSVLDRTGHTVVEWDTDLRETVEAANLKFNEMIAAGHVGAVVDGPKTLEQIKEFDPTAGEIMMVPQFVGG